MAQEFHLNIPCKQGRIQITPNGILQVVAPIRGVIWSIPCSAITQIVNPKQGFMSVSVAFYSQLGSFTCDIVSRGNFAKLQQAIQPYLATMQPPTMPPRT